MRANWKRTGVVTGCFTLLAVVLTVAVLLTPGAGTQVAAQDSATPAASPAAKPAAAKLYQDFLTKLAANLGINDPARVDAAIKTTLNQMVDEQVAAGHIQQQAATVLKQRIDKGAFAKVFSAILRSRALHRHANRPTTTPAPATPSLVGTPTV